MTYSNDKTMKAVGLKHYLPIDDQNSLVDITLPVPTAQGRDLLVHVAAISVNPVDTKVRSPKNKVEENYRVLGWDAVGTVVAVGEGAELLRWATTFIMRAISLAQVATVNFN